MNLELRLATSIIALTLLVGPGHSLADAVLLNNLDKPSHKTNQSAFVGQSFIAGTTEPLHGAKMQLDPTAAPSSYVKLEAESRNNNGSVGQTLFSDFSSSYDAGTGVLTFLANSQFNFQAGAGYWLVLSDPTRGGVTWEFTTSQNYQSNYGFGLASYNTSYYSTKDNGNGTFNYYQPSDGPQMFDLLAGPATVPEPASLLMMGLGATIAVIASRGRLSKRLIRRWLAGQTANGLRKASSPC